MGLMHKVQDQLLALSKKQDISSLGLRQLARALNVRNPETIKYHLAKLKEANLLTDKPVADHSVEKLGDAKLVTIPIIGGASAGPATQFADSNVEGYLKISSNLLKPKNYNDLYALRVVGNSMNRAQIDHQTAEDGDYIIVDSTKRDPSNNSYIIAVVDGLANVKRFMKDTANKRIVLMSESSDNFMPIFVHEDDEREGLISGTVVQVFKPPRFA